MSIATDLKTDLSNKTNNDPFDAMVSAAPTTDMETVVEAVLRMIEDESLNCKAYIIYSMIMWY